MGVSTFCDRMNSLFIFAHIFSFLVTAGLMEEAPGRYCPLDEIDFNGGDIEKIHSVTNWHACGHICGLDQGCKFWTWSKTSGDCLLKNSDEGMSHAWNAISGDRGCK